MYHTLQVLSESGNCKCIPKRTKRGRERCVKPVCDPKGCNDKTRCVKKRRTSSSTASATRTSFSELTTSVPSSVSASIPTLATTCKMTMYDQTYFRGKSVETTENVNDFITIKFDNSIASVKIEGNCCWTLFADKNYQGASIKLKIGEYQSATNIINVFKKASSAKNSC